MSEQGEWYEQIQQLLKDFEIGVLRDNDDSSNLEDFEQLLLIRERVSVLIEKVRTLILEPSCLEGAVRH